MIDKKRIKFKISLLGDPGVGKTSLIQKYVFNFFGDVYIRTMGTKVSKKVVQIEPENEETPYDAEEWARNLLTETGNVPLVFLANKNDLKDKKVVTDAEIQGLAQKFDSPYYFTSAKTGENVNQSFYRLGKLMLEDALVKKVTAEAEKTLKKPMDAEATPMGLYEELNVRPGGSYLIKEEKPVKCFKIFNKLITGGIKGLCITRTHPNMVRTEYQVNGTSIRWLSSGAQDDNALQPTQLPELTNVISQHILGNPGSVIVLEGIEYLIDHNDFKEVLRTIHSINDEIMRSNSILIIPLDPYALEQRELHLLSRNLLSL